MNLKKVTALFMASLMSFSLAGCGGSKEALSEDDQKTQTNEATVQEAETENTNTSTAEGEPVTIKITWWGGQSRHDYTQKLLNKYTELNPNVTFEALPSGWDGYFDKLSTQAGPQNTADAADE
ncbi:hypothetical protein CG709_10595 [Lachnotalea glycerini]|nr:hypothetical protein CG709_10595 [Lachnotalea glycerini]